MNMSKGVQAICDEVAANGAPHLEISWTTRFNAFVPKAHPGHSNPIQP